MGTVFLVSCLSAAAVMAFALAQCASGMRQGRDLSQFWIQHGTDLLDDDKASKTYDLLARSQKAGVTHMTINEPSMYRWDLVDAGYTAKVKKLRKAAEEAGVTLIPSIFPIGYGIRYLVHDVNLAAGLPVRDVPYVVAGGQARPVPEAVPVIADPGFDSFRGREFVDWRMDYPGRFTFVDRKVKHSGAASLKVKYAGKLPEEAGGLIRAVQTVKVEPYKYYRLSLWMKTEDVKTEREDYVQIWSHGRNRRNSYFNMDVKPTQDWTRHEMVFTTLDADTIELSLGTSEFQGGAVWFDDIEIAPAGLLNVVRRDAAPLSVTSADGGTVYREGRDFRRVADAGMTWKSLGSIDHEAPPIVLTPRSRIRNRQKLLVSYYHAMRIYNDQIVLSLEEPKLYEMMERQMKHVAELWPSKGYFMTADEIRIAGWEKQQDGENLAPAELLGRYMRRSLDMIRRHTPRAELYIWSDMFTPFHNGRPFEERGYYYMCKGTYYGCWNDLPSDVRIANWYASSRLSPVWFETRGHKQIMCGYYDNPNLKANIARWMEVARGVDDVIGIMYTNWGTGYDLMEEYFRLARTYPRWLGKGARGETGIKEK